MIRAVIEKEEYRGVHVGRAVIRQDDDFDVVAAALGKGIATSRRRFRRQPRFDEYAYGSCRTASTG